MSGIGKLTEAQIALIPEFVDRWTKIGLCTDPADRPRAEAAIRNMYRQGGHDPPRAIIWCGSPLALILTQAILLEFPTLDEKLLRRIWRARVWDRLWARVWDSVWDSVSAGMWDSVPDGVQASVRASVRASMRASGWPSEWAIVWHSAWDGVRWPSLRADVQYSLENSVQDRVRDAVGVRASGTDTLGAGMWDSVWVGLGDGVRASLWDGMRASIAASVLAAVRANVLDTLRDRGDSVRGSVRESLRESIHGAHDAAWLAFYRYLYETYRPLHEMVGLVWFTAKLSGLWELAQAAGWAVPRKHICWVSERHNILARDEHGRLHSLAGPACAYPDGWAIYAVHGVRVPQYVVERPQEISVERTDAERNAEVRRVMIERYRHGEEIHGAAAFIRDAGGERLDHDECYGTLWRCNLRNDEPIVMIEVVNRTREADGRFKHYWLRVPPTMQTAREAVAWTFNMPAQQYAPDIET